MDTLILGIGNPILTDDRVGIKIAQKLKEEKPELEVVETSEAGITLLDLIVGYNKLIIIDSIKTEKGKPGDLYMPMYTSIYAVEIKDNTTFGEKCTRGVKEKIPFIAKQIIKGEKL
jgi:hydrogenase maturation protease